MVGLSSVGNVVPVNRARSAAHQVASAIRQARQYAVANGARYTVTLTGTTIAVSCTASCSADAPSEPETAVVHGAATSVPEPPLEFGPMGTTDQPASIVVTYPGAPVWEVQVTAAGAVRSCSPTC